MTVNVTVVGSISIRGNEYPIFSFPRSGNKVKHDIEFRQRPHYRHCFANLADSGGRSVLTLGSLCLPRKMRVQREAVFI